MLIRNEVIASQRSVDGQMDGQTDGQTDRQTDGQSDYYRASAISRWRGPNKRAMMAQDRSPESSCDHVFLQNGSKMLIFMQGS